MNRAGESPVSGLAKVRVARQRETGQPQLSWQIDGDEIASENSG